MEIAGLNTVGLYFLFLMLVWLLTLIMWVFYLLREPPKLENWTDLVVLFVIILLGSVIISGMIIIY